MMRPATPLSDPQRDDRAPLPSTNQLEHTRRFVHALFAARHDIAAILRALASALTVSLCDGCGIMLVPTTPVTRHGAEPSSELAAAMASVVDPGVHAFSSSDQARATLPATYRAYITRFGLRGLAIMPLASTEVTGMVVATRDGGSWPFHTEDLAEIRTYVEYASLAVESALRVGAERAALQAEREAAAQFHQEMLGIVGHDLRAPLGAILLSTEILATGSSGDPSAAAAVTRIVSFTKRMARMVDQLLALTSSRLGGGIALARSPTRLLPVIKSVIEDLRLTHRGCRFELDAVEIRGPWDADRLGQVVFNVLSNAVHFGLEGGAITVCTRQAEDTATITVHNEIREQPITPQALASLFEPYHRGWDRDHTGTGLGLGLYITREIVRAHGGTIVVESSPSGTTCHIVLPCATMPTEHKSVASS